MHFRSKVETLVQNVEQMKLFKEKSKIVGISMKPEVHEELKRQASKMGVTKSAYVAMLIAEKRNVK